MTRPRKRRAPEPVRRWETIVWGQHRIVYARTQREAAQKLGVWPIRRVTEAAPLDPCGGYFDGREGGT